MHSGFRLTPHFRSLAVDPISNPRHFKAPLSGSSRVKPVYTCLNHAIVPATRQGSARKRTRSCSNMLRVFSLINSIVMARPSAYYPGPFLSTIGLHVFSILLSSLFVPLTSSSLSRKIEEALVLPQKTKHNGDGNGPRLARDGHISFQPRIRLRRENCGRMRLLYGTMALLV